MNPRKLINFAIAMIVLAAISPARADGPTPRQACLQSKTSAPTWKAECDTAISKAKTEINQYDQMLSALHIFGNTTADPTPSDASVMILCVQGAGSLAQQVVNCEKGVAYVRAYTARFESARAANNAALISRGLQDPGIQKMMQFMQELQSHTILGR